MLVLQATPKNSSGSSAGKTNMDLQPNEHEYAHRNKLEPFINKDSFLE